MTTSSTLKLFALASVIACAGGVWADEWSKIVYSGYDEGVIPGGFGINDYVQDGLVVWYDGMHNVAKDQPHSASAERWANLGSGGSDYDMTFSDVTKGEWQDNAYAFNGASYAIMANELDLIDGTNFTIEAVLDIDSTEQVGTGGVSTYLAATKEGGAGNQAGVYTSSGYKHKTLRWEEGKLEWTKNKDETVSSWKGKYFLGVVTNCYLRASQVAKNPFDEVEVSSTVVAGKGRTPTKWTLGGDFTQKRYAIGLFHSVRFYNRMLSTADLRINQQVDNWRFRKIGNVLEQTDVAGDKGIEHCVSGVATFAPESITVGQGSYVPIGYTLEVWNETGNIWELIEESSVNSFTYTNCLARERVRLTWKTRATARIRSLTHPDVNDYVSNGLFVHYDGIRNVSRTNGYDRSATSWANLGINGSAQDLTFSDAAKGEWSDQGYQFKASSYAQMANACSFGDGKNFTFEIVLTNVIDGAGNQLHDFLAKPTAGKDNAGVFCRINSTDLYWEDKELYGSDTSYNVILKKWEKKYIIGIVTNGYRVLSQIATNPLPREVTLVGTKQGYVTPMQWTIGGPSSTSISGYRVNAIYHAARFYNRVLTTEELKWNRAVDELRFRGAEAELSAVTNVIVVSKLPEGLTLSGQQDGAYVVEGAWDFKPLAATNAKGKEVLPAGCMIEPKFGS